MTKAISRRGVWILLLLFVCVWFGNLEYRKLIRPDEGRYAEIPREMVVSGDWITPRLNDLKYFEKPPLQYWATAVAYRVFGEHQWTSRLWTAVTGLAGIWLTIFTGMRLFGREAGCYAGMILGGSMLYSMMAHINTLDMGVTFFITLGIFALLIAQQQVQLTRRRNWMLLAWAGLALAVLSKGLMGIVLPGAALFLYSLLNRDSGIWKRMHWLSGLALFFLIVTPWFVLVIQANPEFFDRFFIYEHYTRFTTKVHGRYHPWYYFVPVLILGMLPWTLLMLDVVVRAWRAGVAQTKAFSAQRFLLVWAGFIYLFFSISGSKLPSYLLPMFPALALLMGQQIAGMGARRLFWLTAPVAILPAIALVIIPIVARKLADTPVQLEMYTAYTAWLLAAAAIWLMAAFAGMWGLRREKKLVAVMALAFGSLIASQIATSGYNAIARERSSHMLADAIKPLIKPEVPFYSVFCYEQTLPFYLKRTFTLVDFKDEMDFGIQQEPQRWIPTVEILAQRWHAQTQAYAIIPARFFHHLENQKMAMQELFRDEQYVVVSKP